MIWQELVVLWTIAELPTKWLVLHFYHTFVKRRKSRCIASRPGSALKWSSACFPDVQRLEKCANLVKLDKCCNKKCLLAFSQQSASIQSRTSFLKFRKKTSIGGKFCSTMYFSLRNWHAQLEKSTQIFHCANAFPVAQFLFSLLRAAQSARTERTHGAEGKSVRTKDTIE